MVRQTFFYTVKHSILIYREMGLTMSVMFVALLSDNIATLFCICNMINRPTTSTCVNIANKSLTDTDSQSRHTSHNMCTTGARLFDTLAITKLIAKKARFDGGRGLPDILQQNIHIFTEHQQTIHIPVASQ